jgi:type II secretory pathway pseudopilin PulG
MTPRRSPAQAGTRTRTARGLAAFEAVLAFVMVGTVLALAAGLGEGMKTRLRQDLASRQLALLREATLVYYLNQGEFPPGRADLAATDAWKALRSTPPAAKLLAAWPSPIDSPAGAEPIDPWRRPYRYLCDGNDRSKEVVANGGWPIFVSSGPYQRFGGPADPAGELDNRGTDELPQLEAP